MKERMRSDSQRLKRTQGWKLTSSSSLGFWATSSNSHRWELEPRVFQESNLGAAFTKTHAHIPLLLGNIQGRLWALWLALTIPSSSIPSCCSVFPEASNVPRIRSPAQDFTMKESVRSGIPVSLTQASITPWISAVMVDPEMGWDRKKVRPFLSFPTNLTPSSLLSVLFPSHPISFLPSSSPPLFFLPSFCPSIHPNHLPSPPVLANLYQLHSKHKTLWWSSGDKDWWDC